MAAAFAALVSLSLILDQLRNPPPTHHFSLPNQHIQSMHQDVGVLIDFLEKYPTRRLHEIHDLEKRIVDAAHEAEDIIESYVVRQIRAKYHLHQSSAPFLRNMQNEIRELLPIQKVLMERAIVEVIEKFIPIRREVDEIRSRAGVEDVGYGNTTTAGSTSRPVPGGKNMMIGFDEHLNQVQVNREIFCFVMK